MKGLISFDLDGVLANFTRGFTRIANKHFGTPVGDIGSQQNWMFEDFPELGLTKDMCDFMSGPIWDEIRNDPKFWATLDPTNVSVMERINHIKNKIFITNRLGVNPREQSVEFLERWGVVNPLVVVAEKKAPVAREYNVVAHVDDYLKNMVELEQDGPRPLYLAMHHLPYNREWHAQFTNYPSKSRLHDMAECAKREIWTWLIGDDVKAFDWFVDKEITLSVEQFIDNCEMRGLVQYV